MGLPEIVNCYSFCAIVSKNIIRVGTNTLT